VTTSAVFDAMGTTLSVVIEGAPSEGAEAALVRLRSEIEGLEASLSAWRPDSALARARRGEDVDDAALREVRSLASLLSLLTGGAFDPRGPGGLDLDGVAKGWIVDRAAEIAFSELAQARISVAAGGDVWLRGVHRVGVAHPRVRSGLVAALACEGGVATSGTSERGCHVRAPDGAPLAFLQATVCAPALWLADGLATALLVAGERLEARLAAIEGVGWLVVTHRGEVRSGGAVEVLMGPSGTAGDLVVR